jgi:hypothetical protein
VTKLLLALVVLAAACSQTAEGDGGKHRAPSHVDQAALGEQGLLSTKDGYTLVPERRVLQVGAQTLRFKVQDREGLPVTSYVDKQTKRLHFYLVRADLTGFVHEHPTMAADGSWSVPVTLTAPGPYRMYADFTTTDAQGAERPLVLSAPLTAPGGYPATPLPPPTDAQEVDGLTVRQEQKGSSITFRVEEGGKAVTDLEPYLDAFGHLTAVHQGDLAFQHLHPVRSGRGPEQTFSYALPQPGSWRLFLQLQRGGVLRTFAFTVEVPL